MTACRCVGKEEGVKNEFAYMMSNRTYLPFTWGGSSRRNIFGKHAQCRVRTRNQAVFKTSRPHQLITHTMAPVGMGSQRLGLKGKHVDFAHFI